MTDAGGGNGPVGVRRMAPAGTGDDARFAVERLRWVDPGAFSLRLGAWVAVQEGDEVWVGEVVVPADRVLEWADQGGLPIVTRLAAAGECPPPPRTDGRRLLDSLGFARDLLSPD